MKSAVINRRFFTRLGTFTLAFAIAVISLVVFPPQQVFAAPAFGIGSKAPALDVEHWVQDGNGRYEPVTEFEDGKVYVVEFWATWCGPCIMSMPHLAELQEKFRDQDVRIVSISDESLDEVNALLAQKNPQLNKTFEEITSVYSLTTDPDRSVYEDYMVAADVNGIPSAFLVGKTGLVEWIGHPAELEEPIEKILSDDWDREKAKSQWERQKAMQQMSMFARQGRFDDALAIVTEQIALAEKNEQPKVAEYWQSVKYSLMLSAGKLDDDVIKFYQDNLVQMKDSPQDLARFVFSLYGVYSDGGDVGPLAESAIAQIEASEDKFSGDAKPLFYHSLALMNEVNGDLTAAVDRQRQAVEAASGPQKQRLEQMLEVFEENLAMAEKALEEKDETTEENADKDAEEADEKSAE